MTVGEPDRWHLDRGGQASGPHTLPELYRLLETGAAAPTDPVWKPGSFTRRTLAEVVKQARGPAAPPRGRNYLVRHWQGDLPLGVSYWVNLVLLGLAWQILVAIGAAALTATRPSLAIDHRTAILLTILVIAPLPVMAWQVVGTWRSSDRHKGRGGKQGWAIAAKVMLVLGGLRAGVELGASTIPTTVNAWRHATLMAGLPPAEFIALRAGREIEFRGGVHPGSAERLQAFLDQHPQARVLHLESPGGDLSQGHAMAAVVRARGLDTYVRGICASACTQVFLAGRDRWLKQGGRLGFHAPRAVAAGTEGAMLVEEERLRLRRAGIPDWFVARAYAAQGDALWLPTAEELLRAGFATEVTEGHHLSPGLPASPVATARAESLLRANALGLALEATDPGQFRRLATTLRDTVNDGGTDGDITALVERAVAPIYIRALAMLPDREVITTIRTVIDIARQIGARDAGTCRDWLMHRAGDRQPVITPHVTGAQAQALVRVMAEAVTIAADPALRTAAPRQAPPQLDLAFRRLSARLPHAQVAVLDDLEGRHPPALVCTAITELFAEILRLPEREAGAVLRFLFANA